MDNKLIAKMEKTHRKFAMKLANEHLSNNKITISLLGAHAPQMDSKFLPDDYTVPNKQCCDDLEHVLFLLNELLNMKTELEPYTIEILTSIKNYHKRTKTITEAQADLIREAHYLNL